MDIVAVESTNLFIGSEAAPRQVVRIVLRGSQETAAEPAQVRDRGRAACEPRRRSASGRSATARRPVSRSAWPSMGPPVAGRPPRCRGRRRGRPGHAAPRPSSSRSRSPAGGCSWSRTSTTTRSGGTRRRPTPRPGARRSSTGPRSRSRALRSSRRTSRWPGATRTTSSSSPSSTTSSRTGTPIPEDREYVRQLLAEGRLEFVGGTYNEPNTNLTSAESTIRNAIYGIGYQRDVLGGAPATAWQLDAFGHDPQFPGIMADAGVTSSSWARGPFHEWGPNWVRGPGRMGFAELAAGDHPRMQFPMEFDWIAPSGRALLTSFMADHYSAGWWMDAAPTLEAAEAEVHRLFTELATLAATQERHAAGRHRLHAAEQVGQPRSSATGTAATSGRGSRCAIPREFFDAVRAAQAATGPPVLPADPRHEPDLHRQGRLVHRHQAGAAGRREHAPRRPRSSPRSRACSGARFPTEAIDKAWRQLLFGAHHDGITGSESDQVYLDLIGGWREAVELGTTVLDGAIEHLARPDRHGRRRPGGHRLQRAVVAADGHRAGRGRPARRSVPWARACVDDAGAPSRSWSNRPIRASRRAGPGDDRVPRPRRARRRLPDVPRACPARPRSTRPAGGRSTTLAIENETYRVVGRSGPRRRDRQPRRQAHAASS